MASILAHQFVKQGNQVRLITHTPCSEPPQYPFEVHRNPGHRAYFRHTAWCDAYLHIQLSLKGLFPLLILPRPLFISHQTWTTGASWKESLKRKIFGKATNIAISKAVAAHLKAPSHIVFNTYQSDIFKKTNLAKRQKELVFLGRLVSIKGADLLIQALHILKKHHKLTPKLTIVGFGEDEPKLRQQVADSGLSETIRFVGQKTGENLAQELNQHQIIVVPSRWAEPFGIVALEGMACGCVPIVSEQGGLPDAIGKCGLTFENNNAQKLAEAIRKLLTQTDLLKNFSGKTQEHIKNYSPENIAKQYLRVFEKTIAKK